MITFSKFLELRFLDHYVLLEFSEIRVFEFGFKGIRFSPTVCLRSRIGSRFDRSVSIWINVNDYVFEIFLELIKIFGSLRLPGIF